MEFTGLVAAKAMKLMGRQYQPGEPVDTSELPDYKIRQLLSQRFLRPGVAVEEKPSVETTQ